MKTFDVSFGRRQAAPSPSVATVGFFDGVHRGHRFLIGHVVELARQRGFESTVVTFSDHPRRALHAEFQPRLLSTLDEKVSLLAQTGVDNCAILRFDEAVAALTAREFMERVLLGRLGVRVLVVGYDNRFGCGRTEGFAEYVAHGRELGIEVLPWRPLLVAGVGISSSMVRSLLQEGEVGMAARCLGYRYAIGGTVVHGRHVGTSLGFATANLSPDDALKIVPAAGVYATLTRLDDSAESLASMTNIGSCPTFDGTETTIETHIFGHEGELYGHRLTVTFVARLRGERKFRSSAELAGQLRHDREAAIAALRAGNAD